MNFGCGFNMTWMVGTGDRPASSLPAVTIDEAELDFIAEAGFTFIRVPLDYRFWIHDFSYDAPSEKNLLDVDRCVSAVVSRGLHCSLNIHRAPGYCINRPDLERHNLWTDMPAEDAFVAQWTRFATRYRSIPHEKLSFDLLNEPPEIGRYGMTREIHGRIIRRTVAAIREIDPGRTIVIDGLGGGNIAMPDLADLCVVMSGRGYQPMALTHFKAGWCADTENIAVEPEYPDTLWKGRLWNRETLRDYYAPWKALSDSGTPVHIGEFGCYDTVHNSTALAWFEDLLSLFREYGWGYALWNFRGPFGITGHRRPGTRQEKIRGITVDRDLFELLIGCMPRETPVPENRTPGIS